MPSFETLINRLVTLNYSFQIEEFSDTKMRRVQATLKNQDKPAVFYFYLDGQPKSCFNISMELYETFPEMR
jgi:hypothetical protein